MTENTIADNFLSQIDDEGHYQILHDEIIYHKRDGTKTAFSLHQWVIEGMRLPKKDGSFV